MLFLSPGKGKRWAVLSDALCLVVALVSLAPMVWAQSAEFTGRAKQAILIDVDTGAILYQHDIDELMPPASMSKLMTLAVLFKALKDNTVQLSDEFLMSEHAWRTGGAPSGTSAMMVPVNTRARVDELIQGIIIQSGNDAAIAIAEGLSRSESAFAAKMTQEARALGLKKSVFKNATGLHHPEHLMTARELAMLARHIIQTYPEQYKIFAQREFHYRRHRFFNRNPLLSLDFGADGLKTGFIKEAGYGIVASAKQGGRRLVAVLNGLPTAEDRRDEARKLIEWGFRSFTEFKLFDAGEVVGQARVWGGTRMYVPVAGKGSIHVLLPRAVANQKLKAELVYDGPLKAPISKGDAVAKLRVTNASNAINEIPLYAAEDVDRGSTVRRGLDTLVQLALGWFL